MEKMCYQYTYINGVHPFTSGKSGKFWAQKHLCSNMMLEVGEGYTPPFKNYF